MASFRVRSEGGLPVGCLAWLCHQGPTSPCGGSCLRVWWIYLLLPHGVVLLHSCPVGEGQGPVPSKPFASL